MEMSLAPEPLTNGYTRRENGGQEEKELEVIVSVSSLPGPCGLTASSFKSRHSYQAALSSHSAPFGFWSLQVELLLSCVISVLRDRRTSKGKCATGNALSECSQEPGGGMSVHGGSDVKPRAG